MGSRRADGAVVWTEVSRLRTPSGIESRGAVLLGPYAWPVDEAGGVLCVCVRRGKDVGSEPDPFRRAGPELLGFRVGMPSGLEDEGGERGFGGEGSAAALAFRTSLCRVLPRIEGAREATCVARTALSGGPPALVGEAVAVSFRGDEEDSVAVFSARTGAMVAWGRTGGRVTALTALGDVPPAGHGEGGIDFSPLVVGHMDGSVVCAACGAGPGNAWSSFPDATNTLHEHTAVPLAVGVVTLPRGRSGKQDSVTCLASSRGMVIAGHASGAVSAWGWSARDGKWVDGGKVEGTGGAVAEIKVARRAGVAAVELWVRRGNGVQSGLSVYTLILEGGKLGGDSVEIATTRAGTVLGLAVLPAVECPGFRPALGNPDSVASIVLDESHGGLFLEVHNLPTSNGGSPTVATFLGDLGVDFSSGETVLPLPFAMPGGCIIRSSGIASAVEAVLCGIVCEKSGGESTRDSSPDSLRAALVRVGLEPSARSVLRRCSAAGVAALKSPSAIEALHSEMAVVGIIPTAAEGQERRDEAVEDRVTRKLHDVFTGMLDHGLQSIVVEYVRTVCFDDSRQLYRDATEMLLQDPRHVLGDALSQSGEPLWLGYAGMLIVRAGELLSRTAAAYFGHPQTSDSSVLRPGEFFSGTKLNLVDASYVARPLMVRLAALEHVLVECEQILGMRPGLGERWAALMESTKQRRHECRLAISQSRVVELLLRESYVRASVPRPGTSDLDRVLSEARQRRAMSRAALKNAMENFHAPTTVMGAFKGGFEFPMGSSLFSDRLAPDGASWSSLLDAAQAFGSGSSDRCALESKAGALAHLLFDLGHGPDSEAVSDALRIGRDTGSPTRSTQALWVSWLLDQGRDDEGCHLLKPGDEGMDVPVEGMDEYAGVVTPGSFTLRLVLIGRAKDALDLSARCPPSLATCRISEVCAYASALFEGGLLAEAVGIGRRRAGLLPSSVAMRARHVDMRTVIRHVTGLCLHHFLGQGSTKVPDAYGSPGAPLMQLYALPLEENEERTAIAGLVKFALGGAGGNPGAAARVAGSVLVFYMQGHREMEALAMQDAFKPIFDRERVADGGVESDAAFLRTHMLFCMRKAMSRVQQRMKVEAPRFGAFFMGDEVDASGDVDMKATQDFMSNKRQTSSGTMAHADSGSVGPLTRLKVVPLQPKSTSSVPVVDASSRSKGGNTPRMGAAIAEEKGEVTERWGLEVSSNGLQPAPFVRLVRCPQSPSRFTPTSMDPKGPPSSSELWNPNRKIGVRTATRQAARAATEGAMARTALVKAGESCDTLMAEITSSGDKVAGGGRSPFFASYGQREGSPIPAYQPSPPRATPAFGAAPPFQPASAGAAAGTNAVGVRTRSRLASADMGAAIPSEAGATVSGTPPAQSPPPAADMTSPKPQPGLKGRLGMLRQGGSIALRTPPRTSGRRSVFGRVRESERGTPGDAASTLAPTTATTSAPAASTTKSGSAARAALPLRTRSLLKSPGKS